VTIPVSSNANVTARKIYRTAAAAADPVLGQLLVTISDNTTTTYDDNIADGSLGVPVPKLNTTGGEFKINEVRRLNISDLSTVIGNKASLSETGYANTAIGAYSLNANTTGYRNTAIGTDASLKNTTGARNTDIGVHAGNDNVSGDDNTLIGYAAGFKTTADNTTVVGSNALEENVTGTNNTAVGSKALQVNTGGNNTAMGRLSMSLNVGGDSNCAFGVLSLDANVSGNFNCSYGMQSLTNVTGTGNTAYGFQALNTSAATTSNIGIGFQAGWWETGSYKVFIDNYKRASEADARIKALIYGVTDTSTTAQVLSFNAAIINMPYLLTYADNAAAISGGRAVGEVYKTATGELRIVV